MNRTIKICEKKIYHQNLLKFTDQIICVRLSLKIEWN